MMSVVNKPNKDQGHYAEFRYAECQSAECRYAKCRYAECHGPNVAALFQDSIRPLH